MKSSRVRLQRSSLQRESKIEAEDAPTPALPLKKLKDFMRNKAKEKPITMEELK